jgi:hypothetical protein
MPLPRVDFSRIKEHHGTKYGGFEELCCQLAALEHTEAGATFLRKGPGPDQGLECYWRLADGTEAGWQAKYFLQEIGSAQIHDIDESLARALAAHPRLKSFTVCVPRDLRDNRGRRGTTESELLRYEKWRDRRVAEVAAAGRMLEIHLWSASSLTERLSRGDAVFGGRLLYWFSETELTPAWFASKLQIARSNLGERYTPESHVDLPIQQTLAALARNPSVTDEAVEWVGLLLTRLHEAEHTLSMEQREELGKPLRVAVEALVTALQVTYAPDVVIPIGLWRDLADAAANEVSRVLDACEDWMRSDRAWRIGDLYKLHEFVQEVQSALQASRWTLVNERALVVSGPAGVGKSHLLGDFGHTQVNMSRPFILVLTWTLEERDPWEQIRVQLDLGSISTETFLAALDAAAEAQACRAVIAVDALNEHHGVSLWGSRLSGFLERARHFPRIAIVATVRTTYERFFPLKGLPRLVHQGFSGHSAQAAKVYLDRRGIARPNTPNLAREFENPLFLKTCCDYLDSKGLKELPKGMTGVSQLFDFYVQAIAERVETALELDPIQDIPRRALHEFLEVCASGSSHGSIEKSVALSLFEQFLQSGGQRQRSLLTAFINEGILTMDAVRDGDERSEWVRFSFERLHDHMRAQFMLAKYAEPTDVQGSFSRAPLSDVMNSDEYWHFAGVVEALAVQLPERFGLEVLDVVPSENRHTVIDAFTSSLAWRDPVAFSERSMQWIEELAERQILNRFDCLLLVCAEPRNRFNARYLHEQLMALSLAERDSSWSVFLAQDDLREGGVLESLVDWAWKTEPESVDPETRVLACTALTWCLSTPNRAVRDLATKGLARLLSVQLADAAHLIEIFASVDDPYITERLLAACYGAALLGVDTEGAGTLAISLWSQYFEGDRQPPLHLLARDYIIGALRYCEAISQLPAHVDLTRCAERFTSAWPLEIVTEDDLASYGSRGYGDSIASSTSDHGDFGHYTVRSWFSDFRNMPVAWAGHTTEQVFDIWEDKFTSEATSEQLGVFVRVLESSLAYRQRERGADFFDDSHREEDRRLWALLAEANKYFKQTLSPSQLAEYEALGEHFLLESTRMNSSEIGPSDVELEPVRHWICKRAHSLGWTEELYEPFERSGIISHERIGKHRVERMGKKYQRIALAEAAARAADNLVVNTYSDEGKLRRFAFNPEELWTARDIDPSLVIRRTEETGWKSTPVTWWTPTDPHLPWGATPLLLAWLWTRSGLANGMEEIAVADKDGQRWLILDCFRHWTVAGQRRRNHADAWSRIRCLVTRKGMGETLAKDLLSQHRGDGQRMPSGGDLDCFLGEHPWRARSQNLGFRRAASEGISVACAGVVSTLTAESVSSDNSIEENFSLHVPAAGLMQLLDIRLRNGSSPNYVDREGAVRFFDPSLQTFGPSAAVVSREYFLDRLTAAGLEPVWVLAGEKNVYSGESISMKGFGGRLYHTTVVRTEGAELMVAGSVFEELRPSSEDLRVLFEHEEQTK